MKIINYSSLAFASWTTHVGIVIMAIAHAYLALTLEPEYIPRHEVRCLDPYASEVAIEHVHLHSSQDLLALSSARWSP